MERIKYRTTQSGWMSIGGYVSDPVHPTLSIQQQSDVEYEWELLDTKVIVGKGSATYQPSSGSTSTIVFGTAVEAEQFNIFWTWKGILKLVKDVDKSKIRKI